MTRRRVLFYVQHLLGIGHQRRGAALTRAMQAAGMEVTYVSGGYAVPGLDLGGAKLAQLPPARAQDLRFTQLVDAAGRPIDDAWRRRRKVALLRVFEACDPHAVVLEMFPFGRRQMRFELLPLLQAARVAPRKPLVVSSVRDILVPPSKPGRTEEMLVMIERYFDQVLVHGDPTLIPFEASFAPAPRIAGKLHYTGYVVDRRAVPERAGRDRHGAVIVSSGGGAVGTRLLHAAMAARARTALHTRTWRVLAGVTVAEEELRELAAAARPGIIVERARDDFPSLLANCALSISQGGYNTVLETIVAGCRSVVVPYAGGGREIEQPRRAELLARRGLLTVVPEAELSASAVATAVGRALATPRPPDIGIRLDGAQTTARLLAGWIGSIPRSGAAPMFQPSPAPPRNVTSFAPERSR